MTRKLARLGRALINPALKVTGRTLVLSGLGMLLYAAALWTDPL